MALALLDVCSFTGGAREVDDVVEDSECDAMSPGRGLVIPSSGRLANRANDADGDGGGFAAGSIRYGKRVSSSAARESASSFFCMNICAMGGSASGMGRTNSRLVPDMILCDEAVDGVVGIESAPVGIEGTGV